MDVIRGRAWKYGDNVNTDVIYPGKYTYTVSGREEIARHALEDLDPAFVTGMQPGQFETGSQGILSGLYIFWIRGTTIMSQNSGQTGSGKISCW